MSAPLTADQALAIVRAWASTKKRHGKEWGVIWDPQARPIAGFEEVAPCMVVSGHNGVSYDVKGWGPTWEEALRKAKVPIPGDETDPGQPAQVPQPGAPFPEATA